MGSHVELAKQVWASPAFPHQEVRDPDNDWDIKKSNGNNFLMHTPDGTPFRAENPRNLTQCLNRSHDKSSYPPDISAVSYYSDGKSLNTVLWLTSPFREPNLNKSISSLPSFSTYPWHTIGYTMSIDVLSTYDTGTDYYLEIVWDIVNQTWTRTLSEGSSTGEKRILQQDNNYTHFFEKNKNYVLMSLNLTDVSSPDEYRIILSAWDNFLNHRRFCSIVDITNWIFAPPPEFVITTIPGSTVMRPGDETNIEVQIKSDAKLKSYVYLSSEKTDGMELNFVPNRIYVPPYGTTTSLLHVKAFENAEIRPYTLPIMAKILFRTEGMLRNSTVMTNNTLLGSTRENLDFAIDVLKPFTLEERLTNFYNSWFTPITGMYIVISGIIAAIAPSILKKYRNKKRKNNDKNFSNGN